VGTMFKLFVLLTILGITYCVGIGGFYNPYPPQYGPQYGAQYGPQYGAQYGACRQPVYNANGTHSVFIGCVKSTDKLLFNQLYNVSGSYFSTAQKLVKYPKPGYLRNEIITGIWLFDYDRYGKGGYGRIMAGGVGYNNVTIQLRSYKWGRGFNFLVQIYGY
ncbi:hypothetical protein AMK59_2740, partial [Oryctes borbonicus]